MGEEPQGSESAFFWDNLYISVKSSLESSPAGQLLLVHIEHREHLKDAAAVDL